MLEGLLAILNPLTMIVILSGTTLGVVVGALPGLSATMGVALMIPITFGMTPLNGLALLGGLYCGAVYGGSISALLLGVPGAPGAVATVFDGHTMVKKGNVLTALGATVVASCAGGLFSATVLLFAAPVIAKIALMFGPGELFMLAMLGMVLIASISGDSPLKGLIAGGVGLMISTTGIDPFRGTLRFTYGNFNLFDGIPIIAAIIGLFCVPQLLVIAEENFKKTTNEHPVNLKGIAMLTVDQIKSVWRIILKSSVLGTIIGAIPGAGTDIAAFLGYGEAKRSSKYPQKFGTGVLDGIVAPEAANNGVTGGSIIPLLTLGVPGNAVTAVLLGGLLIHGLVPGSALFIEHSRITYGFIFSLFIANLTFLFVGSVLIKYFAYVLNVPKSIIVPVVALLCIIGSLAIRNNMFDAKIAIAIGLVAYFATKLKMPMPPICLALILGPLAEQNLGRALITAQTRNQNLFIFLFSRPIVIVLFIFAMILLIGTLKMQRSLKQDVLKMKEGGVQSGELSV